MNKETLNKLKELALAATPGPWRHDGIEYGDMGHRYQTVTEQNDGDYVVGEYGIQEHDAAFISAANPATVLELIALAERTTSPVSQMTDATIRKIFMAHGFTIKEGQTDLKPYVYAAARALLAAAASQAQAVEPSDGEIYEAYSKRAAPEAHQAALDEAAAIIAAQPKPVAEQGELPPLPEPKGSLQVSTGTREMLGNEVKIVRDVAGYTADQMREFARAAIASSQQPQDERAAFEAWHAELWGKPLRLGQTDQYKMDSSQGKWQAWQARAALAKKGGAATRQDSEGEKA